MPIDEIKRVLFVGGGTMGCVNSLIAAAAGYEAVVYDVSPEALAQVPARQKMIAERAVAERGVPQAVVDAAWPRIKIVADPKAAAEGAQLMSESVFENVQVKRETHQKFDQLLPPQAIMTTNSSSLPLSEIETAVKRGDKFAAMHFHGFSPLVDLVGSARTSAQTMGILKRYVRSLGFYPMILKKEKPGYLHNTLFINLLKTAALLVADGYGSVEDVDRSWILVHPPAPGPFGMMDGVGLNVVLQVAEEEHRQSGSEEAKKLADFVRPYIERGHLGMKTGQGFYTYPDPAWMKPDFLTPPD